MSFALISHRPDALPPLPDAGTEALLEAAAPLGGAHALVVGHHSIDMLCGLIARGCGAALERTLDSQLPAEPAELVIMPCADSLEAATTAIAIARRSLLPCGRLLMLDPTGQNAAAIIRLLHAAGFSAVKSRKLPEGTLLSADWPMFGLHTEPHHA